MAKKKSDAITTTDNPRLRPTMGTSAARLARVPKPIKGRSVKKTGNAKGGMLEAAIAAHRTPILERHGASLRPTAILYSPNAAEAAQTLRNTVIVPSAVGNRDFYLRRQYGQRV